MSRVLFHKRLTKQLIALIEILIVPLNLLASVWITFAIMNQSFNYSSELQTMLIAIILLWILSTMVTQNTGINRSGNHAMLFIELLKVSLISSITLFFLNLMFNPVISHIWVLIFLPLNLMIMFIIKLITVKLLKISRVRGHDLKKVLLIVDEVKEKIVFNILENREWGYQVVYILTDSNKLKSKFRQQSRIYPKNVNIKSLLRHDIVDEIIYLSSGNDHTYIRDLAEICSKLGVDLLLHPLLEPLESVVPKVYYIGKTPFSFISNSPRIQLSYHLKTALEMLFACASLFILSPLLVFLAALIKIDSRGPVIFKQQRVGLRGRKFYIYKFRTMIADAEQLKAALMKMNESDGPVFKIKNDPRITAFGMLLRKTGLDEIPQLFNVVKGEMSLIGPRPLLPAETKEHKAWHLKRMSVKPGITCTWQVETERNQVPFDKWMHLDLYYIENWSVKTDFLLFFRTIRSLFQARGL